MPMYTNMYLYSEPSMGARMVPANGQTTKTKKSFICRFGWKDFPSYHAYYKYMYIHSRAIFVLEKGGVLLLGTVLLLGHIRYGHSVYLITCMTFDL